MRAKFIYEKFTEDSDPIQDMGIGMIQKIKKWINDVENSSNGQYGIKDYRIDKNGYISVNGTVSIPDNWGNLPKYIQFKYVFGDFYISNCKLTTLRGCPIKIKGSFSCDRNNLTSLKFSPIYVGSTFSCAANRKKFTKKEVENVCKVKDNKNILC